MKAMFKPIAKTFSLMLVMSLFGNSYAQSPRHPEIGSDYCDGNDHQPRFGGSTFEIFQTQNRGRDACMSVHRNPARRGNLNREYLFGEWSEIDNALIRESQRPSDTNRRMPYYIDITSRNNVYHGGYGWWSRDGEGDDDIVEFYVVEGWNDRENPIFGMEFVRSYTSGGVEYDLYVENDITAGTVFDGGATRTFTQIKCVRKDGEGHVGNGQFSGEIIWETHFRQMQRAGYTPQNIFEISYTVEGFSRSSEARFLLNANFSSTRRRFNFKTLEDTVASNGEVAVYPNPSNGDFVVQTATNSPNNIQVFGIDGTLVYETTTFESVNQLKLSSSLSPGIYLISVSSEAENTVSKMVVNN